LDEHFQDEKSDVFDQPTKTGLSCLPDLLSQQQAQFIIEMAKTWQILG
jgi:hypothetical protein